MFRGEYRMNIWRRESITASISDEEEERRERNEKNEKAGCRRDGAGKIHRRLWWKRKVEDGRDQPDERCALHERPFPVTPSLPIHL